MTNPDKFVRTKQFLNNQRYRKRKARFERIMCIAIAIIVVGFVNAIVVGTAVAPEPTVITKIKTVECNDRECEIRREPTVIEIEGHTERVNKLASYAYRISGNDLDFVLTLHAENGMRSIYRRGGPNTNGTFDHGLCQLNDGVSTNRIFMTSNEWHSGIEQLKFCYAKYQRATYNSGSPNSLFYGYNVRLKNRHLFTVKK